MIQPNSTPLTNEQLLAQADASARLTGWRVTSLEAVTPDAESPELADFLSQPFHANQEH